MAKDGVGDISTAPALVGIIRRRGIFKAFGEDEDERELSSAAGDFLSTRWFTL